MPDTFPTEQRQYYRHPVSVPIRFCERKTQTIRRSSSMDLSEGGLCFLSEHFMPKGTTVVVSIPVDKTVFDIEGDIAYSNKMSNMNFYRTGIAFKDASNAFRAKLAEQMLKIKEYREARSQELGFELSEEDAAQEWIERYAKHFSQLF